MRPTASKGRLHFATACVLLLLQVGCSVGTTEYVRIMPTANQSISQAFARATDLAGQWIEFEPLDNCTDNAGDYLYRYRIQSRLSGKYRGITVSVMADFKNDLLIIGYGHLETTDAMTPETRELFDSIMARLRREFGSEQIVHMDLSTNGSSDLQVLQHRLFNGSAAKFSCR
jgi:hypothetical protein